MGANPRSLPRKGDPLSPRRKGKPRAAVVPAGTPSTSPATSRGDSGRGHSPRDSTGRGGKRRLGWILAGGAVGLAALAFAGWRLGWLGPGEPDFEESVSRMLASEELYLDATIRLKQLSKSANNLRLPDANSLALFRDEVSLADLDASRQPTAGRALADFGITSTKWPAESRAKTMAVRDLALWRPLLDDLQYFAHAKFFIIDAEFAKGTREVWQTEMGFHGLGKTKGGGFRAVNGLLDATWYKDFPQDSGSAAWRIGTWRLKKLETAESDQLAFEDVLDAAVPDEDARRRARTNLHEYLVARFLTDAQKPEAERTFVLPHKYFKPPSQDRHAGIAVVDVDQDGLDDYYLMDRWGRNLLFRNRGDGTFEDVASRYGLDVKDHCSSAVFADFDNDGDPDLVLGRTLARSQYFENLGGRFVDRSDRVRVPLPYLVSAVTAADYDGDGLLDVYFSTYAADIMRSDLMTLRGMPMVRTLADRGDSRIHSVGPLAEFLSDADARRVLELRTDKRYDYHGYRNAYGPPNILLKNAGGGHFDEAVDTPELRVFRHTYQATWADYDGDGDPDLYLANDFAPNNMFRNEGGGRFTDATEETGTADIGFGMGVTWGDYDGDQRQDLYVSNMYSKAGKRIVKQVPGLNPVFAAMARGNSLFKNEGTSFRKISGEDEGTVQVEKAGWSWASQFADFDNDGWLDLYALSGHYTAPKSVEAQVDI